MNDRRNSKPLSFRGINLCFSNTFTAMTSIYFTILQHWSNFILTA